jgi:hypothetical protein
MEIYCRAGESKDDNIIRRTRNLCWIHKATNSLSEYVTLISFSRQQWLQADAVRFHVIPTLLALFINAIKLVRSS